MNSFDFISWFESLVIARFKWNYCTHKTPEPAGTITLRHRSIGALIQCAHTFRGHWRQRCAGVNPLIFRLRMEICTEDCALQLTYLGLPVSHRSPPLLWQPGDAAGDFLVGPEIRLLQLQHHVVHVGVAKFLVGQK